ncbi:MAG TPA: hypothetical protein VLA64_08970 [Azonexus sp.]|nr:hypothetical protein [Azonexus sp.]
MSLKSFFSRVIGVHNGKSAENVSYEAIFKGESFVPAANAGDLGNYLPGLRHLENDVDAYFKDVFVGPVF